MNPSTSEHLNNLNPEQLEAVTYVGGPLLVFAGAGSGKTRVLTRRIAHLVAAHQAHPQEILAVTFTNKAAQEMRERVGVALGHRVPISSMWVSTFHSGCARILRQNAKYLDFTPNFAIYDTQDSLSLLKRAYQKLGVDSKTLDIRSVMSRIDRAKNQYAFSDSIRENRFLPRDIAALTADLFDAYQQELHRANAMDFGDLLCNVVTLFKLEPKILSSYQSQFQHLLIDEYQDTNKVQYLIVRMLADSSRNLCVVGDDDQSIYAFRGATIENILNFKIDFPEAKVVTLEQNYRSTKRILSAANGVIASNSRRQKKAMRTSNPEGEKIVLFRGMDEIDEAQFIIQELTAALHSGTPASQIAVFYRTNAQSRAVEEALLEHGIPYEIFGGYKFYERKEIKDILSYLKLLLNPQDNEAFLRIVNTPTRGIGASSVGTIIAAANSASLCFFKAAQMFVSGELKGLSAAAVKKLGKFTELISELTIELGKVEQQLAALDSEVTRSEKVYLLATLLQTIAAKSGYVTELKAQDTEESLSRLENIQELFVVAAEYTRRAVEQGIKINVSDFLERTSLSSDADVSEDRHGSEVKEKSISLMTLHLAKGLEFDVVFLCGLEEGLLPHVRSLDDRNELEEERRLCYVGITRARKRLFLSLAEYRETFGRAAGAGGASRFIYDIPPDVLEHRRWS